MPRSAPHSDTATALSASVVEALHHPSTYPGRVSRVEAIETHMSWVFLTDQHAWKLKKPACTKLFDTSTPEARYAACQSEVALNRRLAPDVYLGVVPVAITAHGARVGAPGEPIEWLVQMRRLPLDEMLDACIARHDVPPGALSELAATLAHFYRDADRQPMTGRAYRERIFSDIASKGASLLQRRYGLPPREVHAVVARQEQWLAQHAPTLEARGARLVDAHGDLRPSHICLAPPDPVVIDCLEFSAALRRLDPLSELSFLVLECRRLGDERSGRRVRAECMERLDEHAPRELLAFYESCHALVRAAVAVWHMDDGALGAEASHWRARGAWYVRDALAALTP